MAVLMSRYEIFEDNNINDIKIWNDNNDINVILKWLLFNEINWKVLFEESISDNMSTKMTSSIILLLWLMTAYYSELLLL